MGRIRWSLSGTEFQANFDLLLVVIIAISARAHQSFAFGPHSRRYGLVMGLMSNLASPHRDDELTH